MWEDEDYSDGLDIYTIQRSQDRRYYERDSCPPRRPCYIPKPIYPVQPCCPEQGQQGPSGLPGPPGPPGEQGQPGIPFTQSLIQVRNPEAVGPIPLVSDHAVLDLDYSVVDYAVGLTAVPPTFDLPQGYYLFGFSLQYLLLGGIPSGTVAVRVNNGALLPGTGLSQSLLTATPTPFSGSFFWNQSTAGTVSVKLQLEIFATVGTISVGEDVVITVLRIS